MLFTNISGNSYGWFNTDILVSFKSAPLYLFISFIFNENTLEDDTFQV